MDTKAIQSLINYAMTCRIVNSKEWMLGLSDHLNAAAEAIGDNDRCEYALIDDVFVIASNH